MEHKVKQYHQYIHINNKMNKLILVLNQIFYNKENNKKY